MVDQHTPHSLLVTFYAAYGREGPSPLPVTRLLRLLAALQVDAPSVRSSLSRLQQRGLLLPERDAEGAEAHVLSAQALQLLDDSDSRIYDRHTPRLADGWVLAVFSAPEPERHHRHLLRSQLERLGFGSPASDVWIAPARLYEETRHTLRRRQLDPYVELFRGEHLGFAATAEAVANWWDLAAIAKQHQAFLDEQEPVLRKWSAERVATPQEAYRDYLLALDSWRRLPYVDPDLPIELLPVGWPGGRSVEVFAALHELLRDTGAFFVDA
ncbi:PaaX family transcriptional regulator C-terminal domain-containing protein [Streptomyces sp. NPDC005963]|uniref:PaaX family transcriptional regulator n=1 Tax=Streptomyces sp. NPDC005963 TaxID=3156721 RepID=UPI0033C9F89C